MPTTNLALELELGFLPYVLQNPSCDSASDPPSTCKEQLLGVNRGCLAYVVHLSV